MAVDSQDPATERPYRSGPPLFDSRLAKVTLALWVLIVAAITVTHWKYGGHGAPWQGADGRPLWMYPDQALTSEGEEWAFWNLEAAPLGVMATAAVFILFSILAIRAKRPRATTIGIGIVWSLLCLIVTGLLAFWYSFLMYMD